MTKNLKFKMLSSILSFVFAFGIFTIVAFAWYALNDQSNVNDIPLNIMDGDGYRITATMEYYDTDTKLWRPVNDDIKLQYMVPSQEYIFRITVVATEENVSVNMAVRGFSSELAYDGIDEDNDRPYVNRQGEKVYISRSYYVYDDDTEKYVPRYLVEEVMQVHVIKTVLDGNEEVKDDYYLLDEHFLQQQNIPNGKTLVVTFGIFFHDSEDEYIDSDNRYQFQNFIINSIWIIANN